jgi:hypothetical protein
MGEYEGFNEAVTDLPPIFISCIFVHAGALVPGGYCSGASSEAVALRNHIGIHNWLQKNNYE